ncbi:MAG: methyltransferase domain-containing protein [Chloroflexi bacterium]|nr:methyltransferase domain-containing protein [Chloroflexota bacterium]
MRIDLLELICCPVCGGNLTLTPVPPDRLTEVWEGRLRCFQCGSFFPILQGIPHLYLSDEQWLSKAREAEGWVTIHKEQGIYEPGGEDAIDLQAPYFPEEPWISVAQGFDIALEQLKLTGEETILDLGAGRGWAAKHFARLGCRVVALDIVPDENVGLGRAWALMKHAGIYFSPVLGDGERLPFKPNVFDLIFCAAALHHSSNLLLLLQNIHRVLADGGRLCAINEPCISIISNEQAALASGAAHELRLGINETRPNFLQYRRALHSSNFQIVTAFSPSINRQLAARRLNRPDNQSWSSLLRPRFLLWQLYLLVTCCHYPKGSQTASLEGKVARQPAWLARMLLLWIGGELFLLAVKSRPARYQK